MGETLQNQYFKDLERAAIETEDTARQSFGWLFEDAVHLVLDRGGQFPRRYLSEDEDTLTLPPRESFRGQGKLPEFLKDATAQGARGKYWIPPHRYMALFDAVEGGTKELYQVTLNFNHSVSSGSLQKAVTATGADETSKLILNWVVPDLVPLGL